MLNLASLPYAVSAAFHIAVLGLLASWHVSAASERLLWLNSGRPLLVSMMPSPATREVPEPEPPAEELPLVEVESHAEPLAVATPTAAPSPTKDRAAVAAPAPPKLPAAERSSEIVTEIAKLARQTAPERKKSIAKDATAMPKRRQLEPASRAQAAILAPKPIQVGVQVDELPRQSPNNLPPVYPADALASRIEGRVVVRAWVTSLGRVEQVALESSSGTPSLDASALDAVRGWQFVPARKRGVAVGYEVLVPVRFLIRSS